MNKKIKAIVIGIGAMGSIAISYMRDHGVEIVGAMDNDPKIIGMDAGEKAGIGPIGIIIEDDIEAVIRKNPDTDIVIISTQTSVPDVYPYMKICAENKINAITISEDWYWPWRTYPEMADEVDAIAKANHVTLLASGIQDVHWSNMAVILASSSHKVKSIRGTNFCPLEEFGPEVANESYAGWSMEAFNAAMAEEKNLRAMAYTEVLYCIAHELHLTVTKETPIRKPVIAKGDVYLDCLDLHLHKGDIIGMNDYVELETAEGILISGDWYMKITEEGEMPINKWEIEGEPNLDMITSNMHGEVTTSIIAVNRIPDVLNNTNYGFKTVADMPKPIYYTKPFAEYIK